MARYSSIRVVSTPENPKRRYANLKYPEITVDFSDIYVYTTRGDRYDLLAQSYYGDSSLWWIISRANPSQTSDSLLPNPGEQIRIPASFRVPIILGQYDALNQNV
jgi:nucleoid-associated protein YgaU